MGLSASPAHRAPRPPSTRGCRASWHTSQSVAGTCTGACTRSLARTRAHARRGEGAAAGPTDRFDVALRRPRRHRGAHHDAQLVAASDLPLGLRHKVLLALRYQIVGRGTHRRPDRTHRLDAQAASPVVLNVDETLRAIERAARPDRRGAGRGAAGSAPNPTGPGPPRRGGAGDHPEAQGLVGAFEDRQHPGVDEVPRHGVLLGVAHAAVELHRLAGHPLGGPAHVRLHHRRLERALAGAHLARHGVRELAAGLDERGHPGQLRPAQLVVEHRLAEHAAVLRVREPGLERGLHHADGPGRGLEPTVLEALHLQVEALAAPGVAADQVLGRARTSRRTRPRRSACRGSRSCRSPGPRMRAAPVGLLERRTRGPAPPACRRRTATGRGDPAARSGSVRARSISDVGAPGERRPGLHAVDPVAAVDGRRGDREVRDVGAVVGLGHHDADQQLAAGDARQPALLLLLGAALDEGAGEDLGSGDERAADPERAPRRAPRWRRPCRGSRARRPTAKPPYSSGTDSPKPPSSASPLMTDSGTSGSRGARPRRPAGSARRRSGGTCRGRARTRRRGGSVRCRHGRELRRDRLEERGRAVRLDEREGRVEVGGVDPPQRLPPDQPGREVRDRVGDEQPGQHRLELAVLAVVEHDPSGFDALAACARS